jgi:hypothetical protein
MNSVLRYPFVILALSLVGLWLAGRVGSYLGKGRLPIGEEDRQHFSVIQGAALTLLGLIIGFSFSMAINRYDLRKINEEAEANAIGTEYVRASLLPPSSAARVRVLLTEYLNQRVLFYRTRNTEELEQINATTNQLQTNLWSAVQAPAMAQPTPVVTLVLSGMNDVLNSRGYTQSSWWNRIPVGAWILMAAIAICSNLLVGFGVRRTDGKAMLFFVLPVVVSISFFLIADLDSPRRGVIRVEPQNLTSLAQTLPGL